MRVGGLIADAPIVFNAIFPMIVPPKHHVAQLLIASFHQQLLHAGQNHILPHLREKFWIANGRSAVRSTGVYYFGPLNVKKGISVVKRWGAIFTCINYTKKTIRSWSLPSSLTVLLMPSEDL